MTERTAFADVGISWAEVTPIGLIEDPFSEPTFAEWSAAGPRLMALEQALPWIIGDWLLYGEAKWGEMYTQAMDITHYSYSRLSTFVYVCRAVPYEIDAGLTCHLGTTRWSLPSSRAGSRLPRGPATAPSS